MTYFPSAHDGASRILYGDADDSGGESDETDALSASGGPLWPMQSNKSMTSEQLQMILSQVEQALELDDVAYACVALWHLWPRRHVPKDLLERVFQAAIDHSQEALAVELLEKLAGGTSDLFWPRLGMDVEGRCLDLRHRQVFRPRDQARDNTATAPIGMASARIVFLAHLERGAIGPGTRFVVGARADCPLRQLLKRCFEERGWHASERDGELLEAAVATGPGRSRVADSGPPSQGEAWRLGYMDQMLRAVQNDASAMVLAKRSLHLAMNHCPLQAVRERFHAHARLPEVLHLALAKGHIASNDLPGLCDTLDKMRTSFGEATYSHWHELIEAATRVARDPWLTATQVAAAMKASGKRFTPPVFAALMAAARRYADFGEALKLYREQPKAIRNDPAVLVALIRVAAWTGGVSAMARLEETLPKPVEATFRSSLLQSRFILACRQGADKAWPLWLALREDNVEIERASFIALFDALWDSGRRKGMGALLVDSTRRGDRIYDAALGLWRDVEGRPHINVGRDMLLQTPGVPSAPPSHAEVLAALQAHHDAGVLKPGVQLVVHSSNLFSGGRSIKALLTGFGYGVQRDTAANARATPSWRVVVLSAGEGPFTAP